MKASALLLQPAAMAGEQRDRERRERERKRKWPAAWIFKRAR
jgi:hypothetical protein